VADKIIVEKVFNPADMMVVKDFWDKSYRRQESDRLIKSFEGVYLVKNRASAITGKLIFKPTRKWVLT
jgi:hypothetical protein